jgi:hypothetical protein
VANHGPTTGVTRGMITRLVAFAIVVLALAVTVGPNLT